MTGSGLERANQFTAKVKFFDRIVQEGDTIA